MPIILLTQGAVATVCECHLYLVEKLKWYLSSDGYARHDKIRMHRLINDTPANLQTDHIDGDRLNNQCSNLRSVTILQNSYNRSQNKNNHSGYTGVNWRKDRGKWAARLRFDGKKINLGHFPTAEEAHAAYLRAEKQYRKSMRRVLSSF